MERNGMTEEEALKRLRSQMSNDDRVARANVVLCTLWHRDVTQKQVRTVHHVTGLLLCRSIGIATDSIGDTFQVLVQVSEIRFSTTILLLSLLLDYSGKTNVA